MNEMSLHRQWASRPADERFSSLPEMAAKLHALREISRAKVVSSRQIRALPRADHKGLAAGQHTNPAKRAWRDLKARVGARQARRQTRKAYQLKTQGAGHA